LRLRRRGRPARKEIANAPDVQSETFLDHRAESATTSPASTRRGTRSSRGVSRRTAINRARVCRKHFVGDIGHLFACRRLAPGQWPPAAIHATLPPRRTTTPQRYDDRRLIAHQTIEDIGFNPTGRKNGRPRAVDNPGLGLSLLMPEISRRRGGGRPTGYLLRSTADRREPVFRSWCEKSRPS
jgi:hypothetical protein